MQLPQLVERLIAEDQNVLLLDTCCLLDIIRGPARERMPDFEAALSMTTAIDTGNPLFQIALPSPVPREAQSHVADARNSVVIHLRQYTQTGQAFQRVHHALELPSPLPLLAPLDRIHYEEFLAAIYGKILAACHVLDEDPVFLQSAERCRVQGRRPARRGSNKHLSDCQILEEVIALGTSLRSRGFARRIVFGSSNTADFCDSARTSVHPDIASDFAPLGIEYAASLQEAHHAVLQP